MSIVLLWKNKLCCLLA